MRITTAAGFNLDRVVDFTDHVWGKRNLCFERGKGRDEEYVCEGDTHTHTHMHKHTHTYAHTHKHTLTHTHAHSLSSLRSTGRLRLLASR